MLAVNVGLAANVFLAILKTAIGILGHSPALLADGVNSTSDVVYGLVVAVFMRLSHKPADLKHPFGHSQFESIAALTVGAFIMTTAVGIFWDAVNTIFDQFTGQTVQVAASPVAFWVALFTVGMKFGLFSYTRRIGRQVKSVAVTALAYDHRNDIFSASAALIGITIGRLGLTWFDPLAAALVALVILRTGIHILRESTSDLLDTMPGDELEMQVLEILNDIPGVENVEAMFARRFGPYLAVILTICVDGNLTVTQGDQIAASVEKKLKQEIPFIKAVIIHYHPAH